MCLRAENPRCYIQKDRFNYNFSMFFSPSLSIYVCVCVHYVCIIYVCMHACMPWHMNGGQGKASGVSPHLLPCLVSFLFFQCIHQASKILGILLSLLPISL